MTPGALVRGAATPMALARAAEPGFLIFGGLGVIVHAASGNGLDTVGVRCCPLVVRCPICSRLPRLSAIFANLVNNLPATLMLVP